MSKKTLRDSYFESIAVLQKQIGHLTGELDRKIAKDEKRIKNIPAKLNDLVNTFEGRMHTRITRLDKKLGLLNDRISKQKNSS